MVIHNKEEEKYVNIGKAFAREIEKHVEHVLSMTEIEAMIEQPKYDEQGDIAFPCFRLAKHFKKSPVQIAEQIAAKLEHPLYEKIIAVGPYINGFLDKKSYSKQIVQQIINEKDHYGSKTIGNGQTITIDFSSPNIAKPFSMGHLRSTVIGNSLTHIAKKCGFEVVKINHLGDWGTQFGKLITAYKLWGSETSVQENPIPVLLDLYVKFHEEADENDALNQEARAWFKKLEDGDKEATALWQWFRDESLKAFSKIYDLLDVSFDSYHGEAFYNDKMDETVDVLNEKGLLTLSEGAEVVKLAELDMPPCLIRKSDGATLYATRDLTAARYRQATYHFSKAIYVVGQEQTVHFRQFFSVLEKAGYQWAKHMVHVPFGFILKDGKKMSTRKGKVVLLEDVLQEAISLAKRNIEEKNPTIENKEAVAEAVGVGAVIYHDLKNERMNHVEFSLEEMLKVEGRTGPYVQYTHARACSILRKATDFNNDVLQKYRLGDEPGLSDSYSWHVIKHLRDFPHVVQRAFDDLEPSLIARYVFELAQDFNKYYSHVKVLTNDAERTARLSLVYTVTVVLKEGLRLLGIKAPESM